MTSPHTCSCTWPKALVFVVIAGYASNFLPLVEGTAKFDLVESELTFPGKATWGSIKDIVGPITINAGAPGSRKERSMSGLGNEDEGVGKLREGRALWMGKSLPVLDDDGGTVVSASLSIAGGEHEINDLNLQGNRRPTTPSPPVLPPPPLFRRRRPYGFNRWFRRFFAPQQPATSRTISEDEDIEILQAGRLGDSPFVYTRRLPVIRPPGSSRRARFFNIREAAPQNSDTKTQSSNRNNSSDDSVPDGGRGTDVKEENSSAVANSPSEAMKEGDTDLEEDIEKGLLNLTDQHTVSVQERQAEISDIRAQTNDIPTEDNDIQTEDSDIQVESNDIPSDYGLQDTDAESEETSTKSKDPDTVVHPEISMPDDQGVNTHIYVNPSEGGEKFLIYFENEGQPNSSFPLSPSSSFIQGTKKKSLKDQLSPKYIHNSKSYSRPRYIIVKEDPFDPLAGGTNLVDSDEDNTRTVRVKDIVEDSTKNIPTTERRINLNPGEIFTTDMRKEVDRYENRTELTEESQTVSSDPQNKSDDTLTSSPYGAVTIPQFPPDDQQAIIFPTIITTTKSVTQIEDYPASEPTEGDPEPEEKPTWRDAGNETIFISHVIPRSPPVSTELSDSFVEHPKSLLLKAAAPSVSTGPSKSSMSGSFSASPPRTYLWVLAVTMLWLSGSGVCPSL